MISLINKAVDKSFCGFYPFFGKTRSLFYDVNQLTLS